MSILDTFYLLFATDAKKASEDIDKVKGSSDKASDSLKKVDAASNNVGASFLSLARQLAGPLAALGSIGGMWAATTGRAAQIRELDAFSSKLNDSIEDVDAFRRSVMGMGGDSAAALDTLVKMGEKVNEAFSDGESQARKDFAQWGVVIQGVDGQALGATEALLNLAGSLEGVSRAEALARIKTLGIEDASTIDLLLRGRAALEAQIREQKELGVVTEENAASTRRFYEHMSRAQNIVSSWGASILDRLIPALSKGAEVVADMARWAAENKDLVTGFFLGVAGVVTAVYLPAMAKAAFATLAATWPLLAIGGAVAAVGAAFALAYEDVQAFLNGQPSLIGELYEKYDGVRFVIDLIGTAVRGVGFAWEWLTNGGPARAIEWLEGKSRALDDAMLRIGGTIRNTIGNAFAWVKEQWDAYIAPIFDKLQAIKDFVYRGQVEVGPDAPRGFRPLPGSAENPEGYILKPPGAVTPPQPGAGGDASIKDLLEALEREAGKPAPQSSGLPEAQTAISAANSAPFNGVTTASIQNSDNRTEVNRTTNVTVGDINVTTASTDPAETGRAVRLELEKYLRDTSAQLDDGVRN